MLLLVVTAAVVVVVLLLLLLLLLVVVVVVVMVVAGVDGGTGAGAVAAARCCCSCCRCLNKLAPWPQAKARGGGPSATTTVPEPRLRKTGEKVRRRARDASDLPVRMNGNPHLRL